MEKEEGNQPSILDYIKYLEFRHDNEQETLYRAKERYISLMKTLKENRELKKENEKLKERYLAEVEDLPIFKLIRENEGLKEDKEYWKQKFIQERDENRRLSCIELKEIHYKQLKEEKKKLMEVWKFYWSGGLLGKDHTSTLKPSSWNEELEKAQED